MKLYYMPGACSLADHITLEWIGKPYETHKVAGDELKSPEYLRINPAGAVPALEHNGLVLTENSAILNYLADKHPEATLGGDGTPEGRAVVNRWLGFVNSDMHPAFKPLFGGTAYLDDDAAEQTRTKAKHVLRKHFEIINTQLEGRDWLAGERSIADPYLYVLLRWARGLKIDLSGLDNLPKFVERMEADAGVKKVLAEEGLGG
ncbi:MAG TPA: glutathione S-transferase N-terminal domain-containing protein [Gammaproteobacteria bacterium]|nr:glutathione S-transferase N-terminal domain-containing protein [Gammaproteobacteria bacterium]